MDDDTTQGEAGAASPGPVVVVIEDDPDIRRLIDSVLARGGFSVHSAGCGLEGIELVQALHPALVTLDVGLPDIDGYEVVRRLHADPLTHTLPILLLSARSVDLEPTSATAYLTKPFRPRELCAKVAELIG